MSRRGGRQPLEVLVVGAEGVGKTCAAIWFAFGRHVHDYEPHVGFETYPGTVAGVAVELVDGPEALLDPDALFHVEYELQYELHVRRAVGVLALFDVTSRQTMAEAYTAVARTQALRATCGLAPLPLAVVGTRADLPDARTVPAAEARAAAAEHGAPYAEVSTLTGENVREAFTTAIASFLEDLPALNDNDGDDSSTAHSRHGCTHQ